MRLRQLLTLFSPPLLTDACGELLQLARRPLARMRASRYDRLHLGCGDNPLEGWGNLDLKAKGKVIRWDLTRKLPVRSGSIEYVFSEHFLEHLTRDQAIALLTECHRVLKPGGILRISTPALEKLIEEYLAGRTEEWREMNWAPDTPCQMVNEGMRLWGHEFVFDRTELTLALEQAGFHDARPVSWRKSETPALCDLEYQPFHEELLIEAHK